MASKDIKLAIRIAGEIDKSLDTSVKLTKKQLRSLAIEAAKAEKGVTIRGAVDSMSAGIDGITKGAVNLTKTVAGAAVGAGVTLGGIGAIAIKAGSDFESAFAGVRKTVDATEKQYNDLEVAIRDMSKNMPMAAIELAAIGEAAGQLGIETENLEEFIQTMADLSVSTNLTSDDAASQFAKFANITGMAQDKFDELGSAVVALGNNMATTEADIVAMGMRLAGAGTQVGMSEADIMGLSAALSSVGIEVEAGGSAMSKVMVNMQLAVETGAEAWKPLEEALARTGHTTEQAENAVAKGGAALNSFAASVGLNAAQLKASVKAAQESSGSLQDFADVANMTSEEFAKAYKEDAAGALTAFISGLNDTERLGESAIVILDSMDIKEVRLRDTLLRASNASGLFNSSLELANEAFEENTALTKEAEQRYSTFESRLQMVQNRTNDFGISLYQNFRDPLSDILSLALDVTDDLKIFDEETMEEMSKAIREHIPMAVREIKEGANAFSDFAGPMIGAVINNLDLIGSGIAGIGAAIVALNVIKRVNDLSKAFGAIKLAVLGNPLMLGVAGVSAWIGVITAVLTKLKLAREDAKKAKLKEHFGEIALSIDEVRKIAEEVVDNGKLEILGKSLEEIGKTEDAARNIHKLSEEISKITWKIGAGFELSDMDKDSLKSSIDSMVEESISLVEQSNYTANVSVQAFFGTDSRMGSELINGFNAMYAQINGEVDALGKQLGDAYSTALEDGVIDLDEAKIINELQGKLAEVTAELSRYQFESKMDRISMQYSGAELTAESFQNVQAEIGEVTAEQTANLNQNYEYLLGQLNMQRDKSLSGEFSPDSEAYLSPAEYADAITSLDTQFSNDQMGMAVQGLSFFTKSIEDAWGADLDKIQPLMQEGLQQAIQDSVDSAQRGVQWSFSDSNAEALRKFYLETGDLSRADIDSITELWNTTMETQFESLQELVALAREQGRAVPESVIQELSDAALIGAIAGDTEAIWQVMAEASANNEAYQGLLKELEENGKEIPNAFKTGLESNQAMMGEAVNTTYRYLQSQVDIIFAKGIHTDLDMYLNLNPIITGSKIPEVGTGSPKGNRKGIPAYAEGGILHNPHLGLVAEEGPEAIIPLDGSRRAKTIWQEAGEILGLLQPASSKEVSAGSMAASESSGGDTYYITYSPILQGASQAELERASQRSLDDFDQRFDAMVKRRKRLSYK